MADVKKKKSFEENCKDLVDAMEKNPESNVGSYFFDAMQQISQKSKNEDRVKHDYIIDTMKDLVLVDKLLDSNSDILEQYLMKKYQDEIKELNDLRAKILDGKLNQEDQIRYDEILKSVGHPLEKGFKEMTSAEYYQSKVFDPKTIADLKINYKDQMQPFIKSLDNDVTAEVNAIKKNGSLKNASNDNMILKNATVNLFHSHFKTKTSMGLTAAKVIFNPAGFASGLVVKAALSVFMETKPGKALAQKAADKFAKVHNLAPKSRLGKAAVLGLSSFAVVGAIALGVEDMLPDAIQNVFDQSIASVKDTFTMDNMQKLKEDFSPKNLLGKTAFADGVSPIENGAKFDKPTSTPTSTPSVLEKTLDKEINQQHISEKYLGNNTSEISDKPTNINSNTINKDNTGTMATPTNADSNVIGKDNTGSKIAVTEPETKGTMLEGNKMSYEMGKDFKNLESMSKHILGENASYQEIKELTMKIAQVNHLEDANKVLAGQSIVVPNDIGTVKVTPIEFKIGSMKDLSNIDIPYGANVSANDLANQVTATVSKSYPNLKATDLAALKLDLHLAMKEVAVDGFIDTMKEPKLGDTVAQFLNDHKIKVDKSLDITEKSLSVDAKPVVEKSTWLNFPEESATVESEPVVKETVGFSKNSKWWRDKHGM